LGTVGDVSVCVTVSILHVECVGPRAVEVEVGLGTSDVPVSVVLLGMRVWSIEGIHSGGLVEVRGKGRVELAAWFSNPDSCRASLVERFDMANGEIPCVAIGYGILSNSSVRPRAYYVGMSS